VRGERVVPVTEFYRGYRTTVCAVDELVVRLEFRVPSEGAVQMWRKVGTRRALAVSKVTVAAVGEVDGGVVSRVGLGVGSVAEVVLPMVGVRREAAGKTVGKSGGKSVGNCDFNAFWNALEQAVETEIRPIDDLRSTARYRRHVAKVLIRRFFQALWGDE
ncbi:MAG: hypothetical protein FWD57_12070, partial [Polyangiaceae bacterium]|nr:hypothetical protein [Polyangiaceae bacterium]